MTQARRGIPWRKVLFWLSAACFLLSLPCVFFGVLGFLGVVADVGPAENRQYGRQFLQMAMIPLVLGVITLVLALALGRSTSK